jgi:hypothetical protein
MLLISYTGHYMKIVFKLLREDKKEDKNGL